MPNPAPNLATMAAGTALASFRVYLMSIRSGSYMLVNTSSLSKRIMPYAAAGAMALGAAGTADAGVQQYVIGEAQLVGERFGSLPQQSVGLATIDGELQLVYSSGSTARRNDVLLTQASQAYAPANSFWGSTGVQNNQGDWELYGMNFNGLAQGPDGSTWNTGLSVGQGIAYVGDGIFATSGTPTGMPGQASISFSNTNGDLFDIIDTDGVLYTGLQGTDIEIQGKDFMWGARYSNTIDGFVAGNGGFEVHQQVTFPELEGKAISDLQLFNYQGEDYVAVSWTGPSGTGGGVQVYNWDVPPISQPCPGDVTGDGAVDLNDLNTVLANFGQHTSNGDANNDGVVDLNDLNIVLANFGNQCR